MQNLDFSIGRFDGYDEAFDWLMPFEIKVNWEQSTIPVMPQSEITYIDIPYTDGSRFEKMVYKNRNFVIVGYTEDGLSRREKEEIKSRIVKLLDSTKNSAKTLTFNEGNITFNVAYSGAAEIKEAPSFLKVSIPFESMPYGVRTDTKIGNCGFLNNGDKEATLIQQIAGPATNPSFGITSTIVKNGVPVSTLQNYRYNGIIAEGEVLIINHGLMTCKVDDGLAVTNGLSKLSGDFFVFQKDASISIRYGSDAVAANATNIVEKQILWGEN